MTLTSPPTSVAPFEKGVLNAGISASDTTITVAPIYKTVNGVRTKQGFNSTSGIAIISHGDYEERISFEGASVNSTTKVTSLTTCVRGLSVTSTSASFSGGTGRIWPKGAKIKIVADVSYFQSGVFTNVANTFTAVQTFGTGGAVRFSGTDTSGLRVKSLTTAQRDALTPANGDFIYNSDTGVMNQYIAGAWTAVGTDATANASTTVAGKVEEATAAELGAGTAAGGTGAQLFINPSLAVKTSSGAGDENKLAVLNSSGQIASGFLPNIPVTKLNSGTSASSSTFWRGDGTWSAVTQDVDVQQLSAASGSTVGTSTTSEVNASPNYAIGAGGFTAVGQMYKFDIFGEVDVNTDTCTLRVKIGTTAIATFTMSSGGATTDLGFYISGVIMCRATGAGGSVQASFRFNGNSPTGTTFQSEEIFSTSFDTTASNTVQLSAQYTGSNSGNGMTVHAFNATKVTNP